MERYILHWGEMGTRWGVSRSVAQVHALLFLSEEPITAEQITETLSIARSNVSTSLKELEGWGLIKRISVMGDRRDHFTAETDPWKAFLLIVKGRKQREIDPTLTTLRQCLLDSEEDAKLPATSKQRISDVLEFLELLTTWYDEVEKLPQPVQMKMFKMGGKIAKLLGKAM
ncbi:GbsR/MarR family transcriptional regulator [Magnetofaba australis]|uniref:HTH-type transcriptional regulator n=1 Tax=Magnetofaba australis IT-1 TaxID=1434232 RepID=A0A1Y2K0M4_9PROT|nr:MarR family transcriptional regulator [Magnetofaba australis]OSM01583.1 putative transcriptional regulator [Magnetofaba australis IT-1]